MIDFSDVRFTYDGQNFVLDGVSLHVEPGSLVAVLGGNGSGKSTLAKHVNALLIPDEGKVEVLGKSTADPEATFFIRSNAGMVFQNPDDQLVATLIENDVAFGPENLGVPAPELRQRVTDALAAVGLQGFEKKETNALSGGQKQRVAIAGMLAMNPQILVLDEASAMLDPRGRAGLMRVCRELNDAGMTIVMITHFMEEAALADIIFVLDKGKVALSGTPEYVLSRVEEMEDLSLDVPFAAKMSTTLKKAGVPVAFHVDEAGLANELIGLLGQGQRSADGAVFAPRTSDTPPASNTALIEFDHVFYSYNSAPATAKQKKSAKKTDWGNDPEALWALEDITFALNKGDFFGIAGHTGSGKSTLVQHMNGLVSPTKGTVKVNGIDISDKHAAAQARAEVGLVFQYPEHQLFASSVYEDVAFGPRNMGVPEEEIEAAVRDALQLVDLDFDTVAHVSPFDLSGGQQRRVAFAGVLAMHPSTLVLDEPAAGLDPEGRRELLALVEKLHDTLGVTVVMISHSMDDLARLCNRILVLNQGAVHALGSPEEVFAHAQGMKDIGLDVPSAQRLANTLSAQGINLAYPAGGLFFPETLAAAISSLAKDGC